MNLDTRFLDVADGFLPATHGLACALRTLAWRGEAILDARTVRADFGHLLVLTADGGLHGIDLDRGTSVRLCRVVLPDLPPGRDDGYFGRVRHRLHASPDGGHAAIVVDRGRHGIVVRTGSGEVTLHLDGGDYCDETVPFSACFLRLDGRDVLIHRTGWNRLDATDADTGCNLTRREFAAAPADDDPPARELDYFHGRLLPSPGGSMLFDDGWVWQPVSVPRIWSAVDWLRSNPWESEDGASVVELAVRDDWTQPGCWIDERRLALWGLENEPEHAGGTDGVRLVDVAGKDHRTEVWRMDGPSESVLDLLSDGARLYVVDAAGTTAWDIESRSKLSRFPGFSSGSLDQARNTLVAWNDFAIRELVLPWTGDAIGRPEK